MTGTPDHVLRNRSAWDQWAADYAGPGLRNWEAAEPSLGHLGHTRGTGGHIATDSGRPGQHRAGLRHRLRVGLAGPPRRAAGRPGQLRGAAGDSPRLQARFGLRFPLIHASAEQAPFADASFDLAISEYGASIWCDPYAWIPEAARILRPGGELVFLVNSAC